MKYEELLKTEEYWVTRIQSFLYKEINLYLERTKLSKTDFSKQIGVSKGYVTQVLSGNFDHRVSTLVRLVLAIQKVPNFNFITLDEFLLEQNVKKEQSIKVSLKNLKEKPTEDDAILIPLSWGSFDSSDDNQAKLTSFNVTF